ncbi:MAG: LUD domain-containing protein [Streptomycetaceae bacterium]|nr:LUD domain-containing protein [Streptomycetaceae bacterium]
MSAREEILARVRAAVADVPSQPRPRTAEPAHPTPSARPTEPADTTDTTEPSGADGDGPADGQSLALFAENVADYRATVVHATPETVGEIVVGELRAAGRHTVVVPTGLDAEVQQMLARHLTTVAEADAATHVELDAVDAVVTTAALGIATTGTIVLDHTAGQGRRELTLVPDTHVCIVRDSQVVHDVPAAVTRLHPGTDGHAQALTWISGPSATSDIELERVEGVHGPRTLIVVLVSNEAIKHPKT